MQILHPTPTELETEVGDPASAALGGQGVNLIDWSLQAAILDECQHLGKKSQSQENTKVLYLLKSQKLANQKIVEL